MTAEYITREAANRIEERVQSNLDEAVKRLDGLITHERELRELTERLGKTALDKAEAFITEKTEEHNNLLSEMRMDRANFVTKQDLEKEKATQQKTVLFYISIAGFIILIIQNAIRYLTPENRTVTTPVTVSQPVNEPIPTKEIP